MTEPGSFNNNWALFDLLTVGVIILNKEYTVLFWNRCIADWTEIPAPGIVGTSIFERFKNLDQSQYKVRIDQVFSGGPAALFSSQFHPHFIHSPLPNGALRVQNTSVVPVQDGDDTLAMIVIEDVTDLVGQVRAFREMKEIAEKELEERIKAEAALKDFAYIVSHDLKAPLRAIRSLSQWIYADYKDKFDPDGKAQLDLLINRVNRMHALIEGILVYSRVGRIQEEKEILDSNIIIKEIIDSLSPPSHICVEIDTPLPAVWYEKTQMRQVFSNLIENAIKYMDKPQGEIHIGCTQDGNYWTFFVKDNGPGIDEKYYERVFQIFQSLRSRDELESTGIGLTIVKKIIEMYGGKIWIESELGKGTTFCFTILLQETAPPGIGKK